LANSKDQRKWPKQRQYQKEFVYSRLYDISWMERITGSLAFIIAWLNEEE